MPLTCFCGNDSGGGTITVTGPEQSTPFDIETWTDIDTINFIPGVTSQVYTDQVDVSTDEVNVYIPVSAAVPYSNGEGGFGVSIEATNFDDGTTLLANFNSSNGLTVNVAADDGDGDLVLECFSGQFDVHDTQAESGEPYLVADSTGSFIVRQANGLTGDGTVHLEVASNGAFYVGSPDGFMLRIDGTLASPFQMDVSGIPTSDPHELGSWFLDGTGINVSLG